jgi:hypothetical protein
MIRFFEPIIRLIHIAMRIAENGCATNLITLSVRECVHESRSDGDPSLTLINIRHACPGSDDIYQGKCSIHLTKAFFGVACFRL